MQDSLAFNLDTIGCLEREVHTLLRKLEAWRARINKHAISWEVEEDYKGRISTSYIDVSMTTVQPRLPSTPDPLPHSGAIRTIIQTEQRQSRTRKIIVKTKYIRLIFRKPLRARHSRKLARCRHQLCIDARMPPSPFYDIYNFGAVKGMCNQPTVVQIIFRIRVLDGWLVGRSGCVVERDECRML